MSALVPVRAGPVAAWFQPSDGMIRRLSVGDVEICRGIYGALRDANWDTVAPTLQDVKIEERAHSFGISFTACCRKGRIRYRWHGRIAGEEDGGIGYAFHGVSESAF